MKRFSFWLILMSASFFTTTGFAQENTTGKISGQIMNNNHAPAAFATVTLLKVIDSALVKEAISDTSGNYHVEKTPFGNYLIAVSANGMYPIYTQPFSFNAGKEEITIPAIRLESNTI